MIVSWDWLSQYVELNMTHDELVDRLTMSGLNHEGSEQISNDMAIDLEVTSNRPDCLGHIGVAREIAVLYDLPLNVPNPIPSSVDENVENHLSVEITCPRLCYRYTARLIRGVNVGPSPKWLVDRLAAIGQASVNNVVDATNYVMFECGQPLHAFDFAKVAGSKIIVREPRPQEKIQAIDHKLYELRPGMCLIADEENPVAIGGVMGGADSEISDSTTDVLIEAAYFNQMSVRNTARTLNLHSPSSFRFERNIDSEQIDWASRRCAEIILESGGGELLGGMVDVGNFQPTANSVSLRLNQLTRVLGIEISGTFAEKTLSALGCEIESANSEKITISPPSFRADLTREVDLIEEVGRVYGFDKVPDDAPVPMAASHKTRSDRVLEKVRNILNGEGFDEAMTASLVPAKWSESFSPWTESPPLLSSQPMLGVLEKASQNVGAVECVRRSLVPSLLEVRRINEYRSNEHIELFETAKVYLPSSDAAIPDQPTIAAFTSGRDFFSIKGVVETIVTIMDPSADLQLKPFDHLLFDPNESGEWLLNGDRFGFIGRISETGLGEFGLKNPACVAEISLNVLEALAVLIPIHENQSLFPSISRDFNLVMNDQVRWSDLEATVKNSGGELLESVRYIETFRNQEKDGPDKKRVLLSVILRSPDETLTGEKAEAISQKIIAGCDKNHGAVLVA